MEKNNIDPESFLNVENVHDWDTLWNKEDVLEAVKKYGNAVWNAALDWAAENADRRISYGYSDVSIVDKESILKGKI